MRQELFGIPIDGLTFQQTVDRAVTAMIAAAERQSEAVA